MHDFTPVSSLLGGLLIGLGSCGILLGVHRIAGVSSILGGLFSAPYPRRHDMLWRIMFTVGLLISGLVATRFWPARVSMEGALSLPWLVVAGLLVGCGTRLGSGCTSGHGVCGLSRFSKRSLVAVLTFMGTAGVTVFVVRHVLGAQ